MAGVTGEYQYIVYWRNINQFLHTRYRKPRRTRGAVPGEAGDVVPRAACNFISSCTMCNDGKCDLVDRRRDQYARTRPLIV